MQKANEFNNFKEYKDLKLGKDEVKIFRLINIKEDRDNPGRIIYPVTQINSTDVVRDGNGEVHDIAYIKSVDGQGLPKYGDIVFTQSSFGQRVLRGKNASDVKLYPYLMLCNKNASNPNRSGESAPEFFLFDPEGDAKAKTDGRKAKIDAMTLALSLDEDQVNKFAEKLSLSGGKEREQLEDLAERDPVRFLKATSGLSKSVKPKTASNVDIYKKALKAEVITENKETAEVSFDGEIIATYTAKYGVPMIVKIIEEESPEVFGLIQAKLE
jgi:hypothetical protein